MADIEIFTDNDGDVVLTDNSDRAEVSIALSNESSDENTDLGYNLQEGDQLSVTFTTASGASTTTEIRVPSTIVSDQESVRL